MKIKSCLNFRNETQNGEHSPAYQFKHNNKIWNFIRGKADWVGRRDEEIRCYLFGWEPHRRILAAIVLDSLVVQD